MSLRIDLNCDLGEGAGHDAELMTVITSANIACGAHAGDETTMQATVALARQHGVAIGAHPGFADRKNFGRREWALAASEVRALVERQVRALQQIGTVVQSHTVRSIIWRRETRSSLKRSRERSTRSMHAW